MQIISPNNFNSKYHLPDASEVEFHSRPSWIDKIPDWVLKWMFVGLLCGLSFMVGLMIK